MILAGFFCYSHPLWAETSLDPKVDQQLKALSRSVDELVKEKRQIQVQDAQILESIRAVAIASRTGPHRRRRR